MLKCGSSVWDEEKEERVEEESFVEIKENHIKENSASKFAGGIYVDRTEGAIIENNSITSNHAEFGGGVYLGTGLVVEGGDGIHFVSNEIKANKAEKDGGGVWTAGVIIFESNQILNNEAVKGKAGGLYSDRALLQFKDNVIKQNKAGEKGGGFYDRNSDFFQVKEWGENDKNLAEIFDEDDENYEIIENITETENNEIIENEPDNIYEDE